METEFPELGPESLNIIYIKFSLQRVNINKSYSSYKPQLQTLLHPEVNLILLRLISCYSHLQTSDSRSCICAKTIPAAQKQQSEKGCTHTGDGPLSDHKFIM